MMECGHHHFFNIQMYNMFSRQHFGMEILHYVPLWSGNMQNLAKMLGAGEESNSLKQYNNLILMFDIENVNKTI